MHHEPAHRDANAESQDWKDSRRQHHLWKYSGPPDPAKSQDWKDSRRQHHLALKKFQKSIVDTALYIRSQRKRTQEIFALIFGKIWQGIKKIWSLVVDLIRRDYK